MKKSGVNFIPLGNKNQILKPPTPYNPVGKSIFKKIKITMFMNY